MRPGPLSLVPPDALSGLLDHAGIVAVTDATGTITWANENFCAISGYAAEELIGANHRILNSGHHPPEFWKELFRVASSGRPWRGRVCNRRKDGSLYWVDTTVVCERDAEGRVARYIALRIDVTDAVANEQQLEAQARALREMNEALRTARDAAQESSRVKSEFMATMSHELRTPLHGVLGMLDLVLGTGLDADQRDCLETARTSARALASVLGDILDFSRLEEGRLELREQPFDLLQLLDDLFARHGAEATAKSVELVLDVDATLPGRFVGDRARVHQVLSQLVGNAVKFTDTGHVLVRCQCTTGDGRADVRIDVSDSGVGIAAEHLPLVFESFHQVDMSAARRHGGTGLGLALASELTRHMGGTLAVQSELGHGSEFTLMLTLPIAEVAHEPVALPPEAHQLRTLVLETHPVCRRVLGAHLTRRGMRVEHAGSLDELLAHLQDGMTSGDPYRLVLVAQAQPEHDGLHVGRTVREQFPGGEHVLVLVGGRGALGGARRTAIFDLVVGRPWTPSTLDPALAEVLREAIHRCRARRSEPAVSGLRRAPLRALVVDDHAINQKVGQRLLERLGCTVDVAANGQFAVDACRQREYDIVLMDCHMPELNGFEATRVIRAFETVGRRGPVPIVAMTASTSPQDYDECFAAGMNDFVNKPVTESTLGRILSRWAPDPTGEAA